MKKGKKKKWKKSWKNGCLDENLANRCLGTKIWVKRKILSKSENLANRRFGQVPWWKPGKQAPWVISYCSSIYWDSIWIFPPLSFLDHILHITRHPWSLIMAHELVNVLCYLSYTSPVYTHTLPSAFVHSLHLV